MITTIFLATGNVFRILLYIHQLGRTFPVGSKYSAPYVLHLEWSLSNPPKARDPFHIRALLASHISLHFFLKIALSHSRTVV